ncbi:MAG TPA: type 4a pilus biogenesis protein PilO [Nannocystis sp.]
MLSPESLARLSVLQRLLIWVLGASVAAMVGYALFYVPARADLLAAANELEAAQARRRGVEEELAQQQAFAEQLARDEKAVVEAVATTPGADGKAPELLYFLPELAQRHDVQIERWQPQTEEPVEAWGVRAPVRVEARGTWASFVAFTQEVAALPETIVLDELVLRWDDDSPRLQISFRAGAVRVRPEVANPSAQPVTRAPGPELASGPDLLDPDRP